MNCNNSCSYRKDGYCTKICAWRKDNGDCKIYGHKCPTKEIDLDVFFPKINGFYRPICLYNGIVEEKCPNNRNSLCSSKYKELPKHLYHEFDGKNAIKCLCG